MSPTLFNPIGSDAGGPVITSFLVFIGVCLLWVFMLATQDDDPERLYTADRSLSPAFNGFAMAGEQISVVSLFATTGAIALFGYDGFATAIDSVVALAVLLLLAHRIRASGRYTLGGLFTLRATGEGARTAAGVVTFVITIPLLVIQLRAGGISAALLIGQPSYKFQIACTVLMGGLVACFAAVADLRGTSVLQVVKVPLTLLALAVVALLALKHFAWDPGDLLAAAADNSVDPANYLNPGLWSHTAGLGPLNTISDHIVVILGTAMLPHLILRIGSSTTRQAARRSVGIAIGVTGAVSLLLITTGFAAAAVVGHHAIAAVDANGQASPILLAAGVLEHGTEARVVLITAMACVAFVAVLTGVSAVTFAAAVSFVRDVLAQSRKRRTDLEELRALRSTIVVLCVVCLSLSVAVHRHPVEFLVTFSLSVAAACVFPVLVYSFFWPGFNRAGLLWSVYGGLSLCTVLILLSPTVSGSSYALWPEADFDWYPYHSPGLVAVPASFLLGWLGSTLSNEDASRALRRALSRRVRPRVRGGER
ncbi:sodium:solute symporter family transporter [Streptomyces hydrogenans]|uniref:sodium:solute symporter family transporter n=1 Tax=Streptomyces hydrogenans TaxID=1873719 RepID=UPI00331F4F7B